MGPVNVAWTVESATVVEVQNHIHLLIQDERLDLFDGTEFRIGASDGGELAIEVAMYPSRAFNDTDEVQVGHDPDVALKDLIVGHKQRGGIEASRFVTLYAANHK